MAQIKQNIPLAFCSTSAEFNLFNHWYLITLTVIQSNVVAFHVLREHQFTFFLALSIDSPDALRTAILFSMSDT